jgi:hypothetical protein
MILRETRWIAAYNPITTDFPINSTLEGTNVLRRNITHGISEENTHGALTSGSFGFGGALLRMDMV